MRHKDGVSDIVALHEITDVEQKLIGYAFSVEMRVKCHFDFVACDLCYCARQADKVAAACKNFIAAQELDLPG